MKRLIQNKILFPEILWERPVHFYKSKAGKILVLAGSKSMSGAAILTCEAIFRSGTGILTLGFPDRLKAIYKEILPEAMTLPLPSTLSDSLAKRGESQILEQAKSHDVSVIGPGLSLNSETIQLVWELVFKIETPIVLDADGLSALATGIGVIRSKEDANFLETYFKKKSRPLVITPHPGEAMRILHAAKLDDVSAKMTADYIEKHKEEVAGILSKGLGVFVVLKGHDSVIANPQGDIIVNKAGGPELATAGSGDVLSGIIGSFIGQNPDKVFEAIATAVYLHGLSGELAKKEIGERSVMASDIIRALPKAIRSSE
jgi:ADP-dependent NAD(P)H-hydrate dehydratase / NAD(P)H-hydrate epimerase